jgi:catechol 2,3-dioxygenase-like lactoylglutathione lyase family enzyme
MPKSENDRRIDYIEMSVADIARAKAFYGRAFGWTFTDYGPTYCEFADGRLKGGFTTGTPPKPGGGPLRRRSRGSPEAGRSCWRLHLKGSRLNARIQPLPRVWIETL